ncbi:MAG: hypothetical protein JW839_00155, partial [Candidatus Lokiarchaeota archaeon]|nr:hypothetical protein [Candidatus Lokiarchaeota archaeon]
RAYAAAIAPALWDAFPPSGRLRGLETFAEVVSFHAMKAAGLPVDQARFRAASLVGDMAVNRRRWLLDYQRYLPPALRVVSREPPAEAWFSRMPPGPLVDAARAISAANKARLAPMRPRIRAGACVAAARKRLGRIPEVIPSAAEILAPAGIGLGTAYNAAVRAGLISRRHDTARGETALAIT